MKHKLVFILIFLLAFAVRVYNISKVPPGLGNDEISIAYNSYSIINTGQDEYGKFFPIAFKSHNDYKAPLYIYITAPFIRLLGNNEFAVRFPSVLFGSLTCMALSLLVLEISKNKRLSLITFFFLAITPWHVITSRWASESNLALFFLVLAFLFFVKALNKTHYFYFSAASFALSVYAYHTERAFIILLVPLLIFIYRKEVLKYKRNFLLSALLFFVLVLPLFINEAGLTLVGNATRVSTQFITNDYDLRIKLLEKSSFVGKNLTTFDFWLKKYAGYISPRYIFATGLPLSKELSRFQTGLLNIAFIPFFIFGLIKTFERRDKLSKVLLSWLFLGPLIPSLTQGDFNLLRNLVSVVPFVTITAIGFDKLIKKRKFAILFTAIIILNFSYTYYFYLKHFPIQQAENWSYGFKEIAQATFQERDNYDSIIIDPTYGTVENKYIGVPGLYILYFNKYDPKKYLDEYELGDQCLKFDKYEIRRVDWPKEEVKKNTLYVVGVRSNPMYYQKVGEVKRIYLPEGKEAFKFYESY